MITFKQFLDEAKDHKKDLDIGKVVEMLEAHCSDALKNEKLLYRGMTPGKPAYILHGEVSTRKSANTTNYYTVILDNFLPYDGYPKRSGSIILSNAKYVAEGYGTPYVVFPFDGVKIGVCAKVDMWFSPPFTVGESGDTLTIKGWNEVWSEYGIDSSSYLAFVDDIKSKINDGSKVGGMLADIFVDKSNVEPAIEEAYSAKSLGLELATTKTIENYDGNRELWIGGQCIAIHPDMWKHVQEELKMSPDERKKNEL